MYIQHINTSYVIYDDVFRKRQGSSGSNLKHPSQSHMTVVPWLTGEVAVERKTRIHIHTLARAHTHTHSLSLSRARDLYWEQAGRRKGKPPTSLSSSVRVFHRAKCPAWPKLCPPMERTTTTSFRTATAPTSFPTERTQCAESAPTGTPLLLPSAGRFTKKPPL